MPYDPSSLSNPVQQVRALLGGAKVDAWLTDDEISARLPGGVFACENVNAAAIACGEYLIDQASFNVDISEGGASARLSQLVPQLTAMVNRLRTRAGDGAGVTAMASALLYDAYGNRKTPAFTRKLGDNPLAGDWPS